MTKPIVYNAPKRPVTINTVKAALGIAGRLIAYSTGVPKYINRARAASRKDVLFIWVPKAAGTSVYNWLHDDIGMLKLKETYSVRGGFPGRGPVTFGHMDVAQLLDRGYVDEEFVDRAFCFSIVRNPYTRAQSLFFYLKKRYRVEGEFTPFLERVAAGVDPIGLYNSVGISQANPQSRWVKRADGTFFIDAYWKLEELEASLPEIREKIGAQTAPGRLNTSSRSGIEMTAKDIRLVQEIYKEDFETFGYPLDPAQSGVV